MQLAARLSTSVIFLMLLPVPRVGALADKTEIFEDAASEADLQRVRSLVTTSAFRSAQGNVQPKVGMLLERESRLVTVVVEQGDKRQVLNSYVSGQGRAPDYIKNPLAFADDAKGRKLPKLKGDVDLMCPIPVKSAVGRRSTGP